MSPILRNQKMMSLMFWTSVVAPPWQKSIVLNFRKCINVPHFIFNISNQFAFSLFHAKVALVAGVGFFTDA